MTDVVETPVTPEVETPVTPSEAPATDTSSSEEAEYQAAMAKIRGQKEASQKELYSEEDPSTEEDQGEQDQGEQSEDKIWKLKVNGKEIEFDSSDPEAVKREVQKGLAAQQKFEESAKVRRQAEQFIQALQANPEAVLSHPALGINVREWAEQYLLKQIQHESLPEEERQRLQEQEELKRYRDRENEEKARKAAAEKEELREKYRQDWSKKFTEALDANNLPKTDWTVTRMAQYMKQAIAKGHKHIQPGDVVELVKEDWINAQKQMFSNLPGDKLIEVLGKETADKIRKADLAKFQNGGVKRAGRNSQRSEQPAKVYGSVEEMRDALRKRS